MKKNLCKTLVMMLVMSSITLTVKATNLSDLFEVGKIYTIHEVGEIIKPYDDHIWADFYDATSVTIVFRFCSNYDDQGLLWWYNFDHESYTPTSEAKFLFNGSTFTAYEEYTPTLYKLMNEGFVFNNFYFVRGQCRRNCRYDWSFFRRSGGSADL